MQATRNYAPRHAIRKPSSPTPRKRPRHAKKRSRHIVAAIVFALVSVAAIATTKLSETTAEDAVPTYDAVIAADMPDDVPRVHLTAVASRNETSDAELFTECVISKPKPMAPVRDEGTSEPEDDLTNNENIVIEDVSPDSESDMAYAGENRYTGISLSESDVNILVRLAYHEARGESFEGQVAVVEVVLNRMLSDAFPDTISEVVYQRTGEYWQFSSAPYLDIAEPTETQYEAVKAALTETEYQTTEDTLFFSCGPYNDNVTAVIGKHYFCAP